ncbi:MAG: hypothetical protein JNM31_03825 [Flavobacteriales bacterium]|nr:hypothetical protein [Flavobacteriales bacterium]
MAGPRITRIEPQRDPERVSVYIDGAFCCGIRRRTFEGMGLKEGDAIGCEELRKREKFFWKQRYQDKWEEEKHRIARVKGLIEAIDPRIEVHVTGFGADTNALIEEHPEEAGAPDLEVKWNGLTLMHVEVTGTRRLRGQGYWVRPDKLAHAAAHPESEVWVVLHYAEPEEHLVCIRPSGRPPITEVNIGGAREHMCVYQEGDAGVGPWPTLVERLRERIGPSTRTTPGNA